MNRWMFLIAFAAWPVLGRAEGPTPNERFTAANQYLEKGELKGAADIYRSLIAQGFESAELYYNLGNLHYRNGERGKAVLWYERALRLSPRDTDIQFNLSLARAHIKEAEGNLLRRIFLIFTGNELSWALSLFSLFFFGTLGMRLMGWIRGENWPAMALWLSGVLLACTTAWFAGAVAMENQPAGVVVNPPGEVRNGPGMDYAVGFTIPEGSDVLLLSKRPEWTQVGVPNQGLKGWMPNGDVEAVRITPASLN